MCDFIKVHSIVTCILCIISWCANALVTLEWGTHSKNSRVRFDQERVPFGHTHFWVRPDQKTRSD